MCIRDSTHGGFANGANVEIGWIQSEDITDDNVESILGGYDGIIVPGGFGDRGIEGMISAIKYTREHNIPTFGICLGMQMMVVEAARHLAGMTDANSAEFSDTTDFPVIDIMPEQKLIDKKGGTMRLGQYPCHIADDSLALKAYGQNNISERHRHRYEVNNDYRERLEAAGVRFTGLSPDNRPVSYTHLTLPTNYRVYI